MSLRELLRQPPATSEGSVAPTYLLEKQVKAEKPKAAPSPLRAPVGLPATTRETDFTLEEWSRLQPTLPSSTCTIVTPSPTSTSRWKKYFLYPEQWVLPSRTIPSASFEGRFITRPKCTYVRRIKMSGNTMTFNGDNRGQRCVGLPTETIPFHNYHNRVCRARVRCEVLQLPPSKPITSSCGTSAPLPNAPPPRSLQSFLAGDTDQSMLAPQHSTSPRSAFIESKQMVLARWPENACRGRSRFAASERRSELASFIVEEQNRVYQQQREKQSSYSELHSLTPAEIPASFSLNAAAFAPVATHEDHHPTAVLYWPAVVTGVHGVFQGTLFESSANGFRLLQMQEQWEDVERAALQAPMKVLVDVVFALDECTEAHHLTIFPESTSETPEVETKQRRSLSVNGRFPDVVSMWNTSMEPFCADASERTENPELDEEGELPPMGFLRKRAAWSSAPVALMDLLAGPVCQTQSVAFLRPSAEVVLACRQRALQDLRAVWDELQEHGLSASALRDAAKRRAVIESFCQPSEALPAPPQLSQDDSALMVHHIPKLQSSTYRQVPAEVPAEILASSMLPSPPSAASAALYSGQTPLRTSLQPPLETPASSSFATIHTTPTTAAAAPPLVQGRPAPPSIDSLPSSLSTTPAAAPAEPRRQLRVYESLGTGGSPVTPMGLTPFGGRSSPSPRPPASSANAGEPEESSQPRHAQLPRDKQTAAHDTPERGLPFRPRPFSSSRSPSRRGEKEPPLNAPAAGSTATGSHTRPLDLDRTRAALLHDYAKSSSRKHLHPPSQRSSSQKSVDSRGSSCCSHMSSYSRDGESPVLGGYAEKYRSEFTKPIKTRRSSEGSWGPRQPPHRATLSRSKSRS